MTKILRIDELTAPPEVGRSYYVNCGFDRNRDGWLPLLGIRHNDVQFIPQVPYDHFHVDPRFIDPVLLAALGRIVSLGAIRPAVDFREFSWRKRRCYRQMPTFPADDRFAQNMAMLEAAHLGKRIGNCGTCPHRGFALGQVARNPDGRLICPMHGLAFDAAGVCIPRYRVNGAMDTD